MMFVRSSQNLENSKDLVNLRIAVEQRFLLGELGEDAANGPGVDTDAVGFLAEEDLRGSVPEGDNFMG